MIYIFPISVLKFLKMFLKYVFEEFWWRYHTWPQNTSELLGPKKVEEIHPQQPLGKYVHTVFLHWIPIDHV